MKKDIIEETQKMRKELESFIVILNSYRKKLRWLELNYSLDEKLIENHIQNESNKTEYDPLKELISKEITKGNFFVSNKDVFDHLKNVNTFANTEFVSVVAIGKALKSLGYTKARQNNKRGWLIDFKEV